MDLTFATNFVYIKFSLFMRLPEPFLHLPCFLVRRFDPFVILPYFAKYL